MSVDALRSALAAQGGTLATVLDTSFGAQGGFAAPEPEGEPPPGTGAPQLAARGPRTTAAPDEYELLLEMILEGSLLHYGRPRVVVTEDRDLALLLGDQLYALGLARLAELGDLESVSELADLISLLSQAELDGDQELARAIWDAGAAAIGWGPSPEHEAAKQLAREGDSAAAQALLQSAGRAAAQAPGASGG
jgi:hypothetical protein